MAIKQETKDGIHDLLVNSVREKLKTYQAETNYMPFHHRLLGKDRYAMFSFIQSMNTTFGMSIWEQVAVVLAEGAGYYAERQYRLLGEIDKKTEGLINTAHYKLRKNEAEANKESEIKIIRKSIKQGKAIIDPDSIVDLFVKTKDAENYFDITSTKPNMKEFVALKLKLLRWTALRLSQDKK